MDMVSITAVHFRLSGHDAPPRNAGDAEYGVKQLLRAIAFGDHGINELQSLRRDVMGISGEQDDARAGMQAPDAFGEFGAVHRRHAEVSDDGVNAMVFEQGEGGLARGGQFDRETEDLKHLFADAQTVLIVIHAKDGGVAAL
jgi:hypothetical protein